MKPLPTLREEQEMAEPGYRITCHHCNQPFVADTFLHIPLCRECFKLGHRGYSSSCWKCKSANPSTDEAVAAIDEEDD